MRLLWCVLCVCLAPAGWAQFSFHYSPPAQQWDLSNGVIHASFRLGPDAKFTLAEIDRLASGTTWKASDRQASSPISVRVGGNRYNADTPFRLIEEHIENPDARTQRQVIVLQDFAGTVQIQLQLEMYSGQPVLRHRLSVTNLSSRRVHVRGTDLLPYRLAADNAQTYRLFRVTQWSVAPRPLDFQTSETELTPDAAPVLMKAGSGGSYCAWMALRDAENRGLFAGWEFDGQSTGTAQVRSSEADVSLGAAIQDLFHPVAAGATMQLPGAFIGLFDGDWDEAGHRTQRFAESVLAKPAPSNFPYVTWDSWGYTTGFNEDILRQNADVAAKMGMELFIVDLGWARQLGDWHEDPTKFPSGLRALSDYVHARGMKFGLHFALVSVAPDAPVLQAHPDWTASESDNYFGALSLCLSNKPTRDWVIQEAIRMIDEYNLDYLLQDGQNLVKLCDKKTHTHDYRDSNYSNAVDGINAVIAEIQRQRPRVVWENCENGGNMMTFNMVQNYVTSITNDASGALGSRQGVWGATYPFSPRFADRYMPEDPSNSYITRSYMFGGPWHFMNKLVEMDGATQLFAQSEIDIYKKIRSHISDGRVFHLTVAPGQGRTDALESYRASSDTAIVVVTRDDGRSNVAGIKLQGLHAAQNYQIRFEDDRRVLAMTGQQLMNIGLGVSLPDAQSSEIIYVEPLAGAGVE